MTLYMYHRNARVLSPKKARSTYSFEAKPPESAWLMPDEGAEMQATLLMCAVDGPRCLGAQESTLFMQFFAGHPAGFRDVLSKSNILGT